MKEKIIVHVCCGVCAIKTIEFLENEFEVIGYWYNPNIHPYNEYRMRVQTAGYVFQRMGKDIYWDLQYDILNWFDCTMQFAKDKQRRCQECYSLRLKKTAEFSKNFSINLFTTTMFYSIHQNHDAIKKAGFSIAEEYNLKFLPLELSRFYYEGKEIAKKWHLYRQRYCGCIFSEIEREGIE